MKDVGFDRFLEEFNRNRPVGGAEIERFGVEADLELPSDYLDFLRQFDGGEGFIGEHYVIFWRLGGLLKANKDYQVDEFASGLFLFGSDGGGEAFAFDLRTGATPVVVVPFILLDLSDAILVAPSFTLFLEALRTREDLF